MSRCRCGAAEIANSSCACFLSIDNDGALVLTGSGTAADPWVLGVDLDPSGDNLLTKSVDGLLLDRLQLPLGVLATDKIEAQSAGATTSNVDVLELPAVTPVAAGRYWKLTFHTPQVESTVANDKIMILLMEGASEINRCVETCDQANIESNSGHITHLIASPTVAAHTYKIAIRRSLDSTGTVAIGGDSTHPSWLILEDAGPV